MLLAATVSATAAPLTPSQALTRVMASETPGMSRAPGASYILEYAQKATATSTDAFYVFNSDNGFVIATADDRLPACLAYGPGRLGKPGELPDNVAAWLEGYAGEIAYYLTTGSGALSDAPVTHPTGARAAIAPMCTTQWGQDAPFNSQTPVYYGRHAVTGCVATAMAQIMKYHAYPEHGTGSYSYTWDNATVSSDFGSATYEWDKMFNVYDIITPSDERVPIGQIMAHCGTALHMQYGTYLSGAFDAMIPFALTKFFGYDPDMSLIYRDAYSAEEWDDIIYGELAAGRPVQYAGRNNNGGHSFVCDGYAADGKYHINWGWAGLSDGYFLLSVLNPSSQGTGSSEGGYNQEQKAVIGFRPTPAGTRQATAGHLMGWGRFSRNGSGTFTVYAIGNHWPEDLTVYADIEVVDDAGNSTFFRGTDSPLQFTPYDPGTGNYDIETNISINAEVTGLKAGVYTVHPAFHTDELPPRRLSMTHSEQPRLYLAVDASGRQNYYTTRPTGLYNLSFVSVSAADGSPLKADVNGGLRIEVTNNALDTYTGEISAQVFRGNGTPVNTTPYRTTVTIAPGDNGILSVDDLTLSEGNYFIQIYDAASALIDGGRQSIRVYASNPYDIAQTGIKSDGTIYAGAPVRLVADIYNFGSTDFSGRIGFAVFDNNGATLASGVTETTVASGQTSEVASPALDNTLPAGTYDMVTLFYPEDATATPLTSDMTKLVVIPAPALAFNAAAISQLPSGILPASGIEYDYNLIFSYSDLTRPLVETLTASVTDASGKEVASITHDISLEPGLNTFTIEMPMTLEAGDYSIAVKYSGGLEVSGSPVRVTVAESPRLELVSAATIPGEDFGGETFGMEIVIANNGDENYADKLHYSFDNSNAASSQDVEIPAGDRITVTALLPLASLADGDHRLFVADAHYTVLNPTGATFTVSRPSAIREVTDANISVRLLEGMMVITGAPKNSLITVTDTRGMVVDTIVSTGHTSFIPSPGHGVWIVTVAGRAFKVTGI